MIDISLFIHSKHNVGGVTTWSCQAVDFLTGEINPRVVSVHSELQDDTNSYQLLQNKKIESINLDLKPVVFSRSSKKDEGELIKPPELENKGNCGSKQDLKENQEEGTSSHFTKSEIPSEKTYPTKPTKPTIPSEPTIPTKPTKPRRPTKPTLPTIPTLPTNGRFMMESIDDSAKKVLFNTKIFIPNYIEYGYKLAILSRTIDIPSKCIGVCHTDDHYYYSLLIKYEPIIQKFVGVSNRCISNLKQILPPKRHRDIILIPYGVQIPNNFFVSSNLRRIHLNISDKIHILYSGRFTNTQKRIFDLIKVIEKLNLARIEFSFDFIGDGPDKNRLLNVIKDLDLKNVRVLSPMSHIEMNSLYLKYHALLMSSEYEGTSITMLEAMSNGVVPIVTKISGSEDIIQNGINGFTHEIGDLDAMVKSVIFLYQNPDKWSEMSIQSHTSIKYNYEISKQFHKFAQIIELVKKEDPIDKKVAIELQEKYL